MDSNAMIQPTININEEFVEVKVMRPQYPNDFPEKDKKGPQWQRTSLPIWECRREFFDILKRHKCFIIVGAPGSGKTTQVPQFCLEYLAQQPNFEQISEQKMPIIACVQPRRISSIAATIRVGEEMCVEAGSVVGCATTMELCTDEANLIKFCTDGVFISEAVELDEIANFSVIILDEVHERAVSSDALMALMKTHLLNGANFTLIIMTTNGITQTLHSYFDYCPVITIPERASPVEIQFANFHVADYLDLSVRTVIDIHVNEQIMGDIMLFLATDQEVKEACLRITRELHRIRNRRVGVLKCYPLLSSMPFPHVLDVFGPPPEGVFPGLINRKCIITRDVSETSLSIPGIGFVLDCGFLKTQIYDQATRAEVLKPCPISQASADQRAKCVNIPKHGKCFRLYTRVDYMEQMPERTTPEIMRSNLSTLVLQMRSWGVEDIVHFDLLDRPPPNLLFDVIHHLKFLRAMDAKEALTNLGQLMSVFPLDAQLSRMIIAGVNFGCSQEMLTIAAMLLGGDCFQRFSNYGAEFEAARMQFVHPDGDHLTLLNVYHGYSCNNCSPQWCYDNYIDYRVMRHAEIMRGHLVRIMETLRLPLKTTNFESVDFFPNIKKALLTGFLFQSAYLNRNGTYSTYRGDITVHLHPTVRIQGRPKCVIFNEFLSEGHINMIRTVTNFSAEWALEIAQHEINEMFAPSTRFNKKLQLRNKKPK